MVVMVVHPFRNNYSSDFAIMSLGMISTANLLKKMGHEVIGINLPMEQSIGISGNVNIVEFIKQYDPDMIIISFHWYEFLLGCLQAAKEIREINQQIICIAAGMSATLFSDYLMTTHLFDYILKDGTSIVELLNDLGLNPAHAPTPTFSTENLVDISFLHNSSAYYQTDINGFAPDNARNFWLGVARGCKYNCTYCGGSQFAHATYYKRNHFCTRPFTKVISDLEYLMHKDIDTVSFTHDIEMLPYKDQLLDLMRGFPLNVYFESFTIPSIETLSMIHKNMILNKKKCKLAITAVSGNEDVRHKEGKYFTNDQLLSIVEACCCLGVECEIYFTLNCINEDQDRFIASIELARKLSSLGESVNIICQPYFQHEIGSIRWTKEDTPIFQSIELLTEYLQERNKTTYFCKNDPSLIDKIIRWNSFVRLSGGN